MIKIHLFVRQINVNENKNVFSLCANQINKYLSSDTPLTQVLVKVLFEMYISLVTFS